MNMQRSPILSSSSWTSPSPVTLCSFLRVWLPPPALFALELTASSRLKLPFNRLHSFRYATHTGTARNNVTQAIIETAKTRPDFIEIGYLSNVHGLQGEICVKHNTDFPEMRFSEPGRRWLRQQVSGEETIQEVQLVEGRGTPGQKSWILKFEGIDSVDQAKQLVGSTFLVREADRPQLEEGEYYTHDLVGMRVMLKETGECLGVVVNVFNYGANDILRVMLDSSTVTSEKIAKETPTKSDVSGRLVWIPFVEAIVPDVDIIRREMRITPPKGLLDLNLRSDNRSKKERRQLEWKERKKFQRRLIAAKKKLCEMEQKHVFDGFKFGEKVQRSLLADQIVSVNSELLQEALKMPNKPSQRLTDAEIVSATRTKQISTIKISKGCLKNYQRGDKLGAYFDFQHEGLDLMSKGKVASILLVKDIEKQRRYDVDCVDGSSFPNLESLLCDPERFLKSEDCAYPPLILVCAGDEMQSLEKFLSDNCFFGFNSEKAWILEEEKLPVVSSSSEEHKRHKILMKTPWEILQSPVGSGGIISLLRTHNILENLTQMGVQFLEIFDGSKMYTGGSRILLGWVSSREADVGIQVVEDAEDMSYNFGMVLSLSFMKKLIKYADKYEFYTVSNQSSHVELVNQEWIPSSSNSIELHSSIYGCLNATPVDKICVIEVN